MLETYSTIAAVVFALIVLIVPFAVILCCGKKPRADQAGAENALLGYINDVQGTAYDPAPPYPYPAPAPPSPLPGRHSITVDRDHWFRFVGDGFNTICDQNFVSHTQCHAMPATGK